MKMVCTLWCCVASAGAAVAQAPPPLEQALDSAVAQVMADSDIPGAAVGVLRNGALIHAKGYGVRSVERREPVTLATMFQVGSVTKVFTATLLLILRDEGVLALDDPVSKYLPAGVAVPSWASDSGPTAIALRHLATHMSGLPPNPPNRRNRPNSPSVMEPYSIADLYQGLAETSLTFEPGTSWSYSNYAVGLLGHALERAAGMPFEVLLRAKILEPLGMADTKIALSAGDEQRLAAHYWPGYPRVERRRWVFGEVVAFGGLASTVPDLARFVSMHLAAGSADSTGPVRRPTLLAMRDPVVTFGPDEQRGFTLGWFLERHPAAGLVLGHGGEVDGHSAYISLAPELGIGVVVLANVGGNSADQLLGAVARAVLSGIE